MGAKRPKKIAYVRCRGGSCYAQPVDAPTSGSECSRGEKLCKYGCIGCGACERACRLSAIAVAEDGIASVNEKCVGCGLCAKACPKGVIEIVEAAANIQVKCMNRDAGKIAMSACVNSCIACGICEKSCPVGAMHVTDGIAVIDAVQCIRCGMCAVKCPRGVIRDTFGIMTE